MKNFTFIILFLTVSMACEKIIEPTLDPSANLIIIDAWLTNNQQIQNIYLTRSQPYFQQNIPQKVDNAIVTVEEIATKNVFEFVENDSAYTWVDPSGIGFGVMNQMYHLTIDVDGTRYESYSEMRRVPPIDSIKFNAMPSSVLIASEYLWAEFVAKDLLGEGDTYWIKAWKNGQFLNKPSEINIAWDAGLGGDGADGVVFIQPIQNSINPFDEDPNNRGQTLPPYQAGDVINVEIHSISQEAYYFLEGVATESNRQGGFGALFDTPLANVGTNIISNTKNGDKFAVGFFNVAAVSALRDTAEVKIP